MSAESGSNNKIGKIALLELRKAMKAKKPGFTTQKSNDPGKRFYGKWRRPKGLQSKMKLRRKGNPKHVEPGYGSPKLVKGLGHDGLMPTVVHTPAELERLTPEHGVVIGAGVGLRKKIAILNAAKSKGLTVANMETDAFLDSAKKLLLERKERRKQFRVVEQKRAERKAVAEPPQPEKQQEKSIEDVLDEKKKAEQQERDKILSKPR